jgi:hypothetical protein
MTAKTTITTATPATSTSRGLTATCQSDTFTTTVLMAALEAAWTAIRTRHPQVPPVVLVLGSGSPRKAADLLTLGHFATTRWQHGDVQLAEVMISGEGLNRTPEQVLSTLLHEAAHGLADVREIKETSRQGRWHNKKFATLATEVGLDVSQDSRTGWSPSVLSAGTADLYVDAITGLAAAMRAHRRIDLVTASTRTNNNNGVVAACDCPRKIRIATTVLAEGPLWCGVCDHEFVNPDTDQGDES